VTKTIRSWLIVPASRPDLVEEAARCGADAIVLDLVELVAPGDRAGARAGASAAVAAAGAGGARVYVQTDPGSMAADVNACATPTLAGVVVSRAESADQMRDLHALLDDLEDERGMPHNAIRIVAAFETARGNQDAYDITRASGRVDAVTLGRADLIMDLRPEPSGEIHMMPYLMQRLVTIAGAAGVTPIGAWWRAPDRGLLATPENTLAAAQRGRAIGFSGAMCLRANQVNAIHRAFT